MKVHFITGLIGDRDDYQKIYKKLEEFGFTLVTDHYLARHISEIDEETEAESELYVKRSHNWMKKADVIIFEATTSHASLGYEIAVALSMMKPVIVLYRAGQGLTPYSLKGVTDDKLQVLQYDDDTLDEVLDIATEYAREASDVRFNFFISPSIGNYLEWISKEKKIPRSVYLRNLIEKDMNDNEEYNS